MHYLLFYEKRPDYAARQVPFQNAHLLYLEQAVIRGDLLLAGSLDDPVDGTAILLFRADSPASIEAFAAADPYVTSGVVTRWYIRGWETVLGAALAEPDPAANRQPE